MFGGFGREAVPMWFLFLLSLVETVFAVDRAPFFIFVRSFTSPRSAHFYFYSSNRLVICCCCGMEYRQLMSSVQPKSEKNLHFYTKV